MKKKNQTTNIAISYPIIDVVLQKKMCWQHCKQQNKEKKKKTEKQKKNKTNKQTAKQKTKGEKQRVVTPCCGVVISDC